jgi:hypothetical protein
MKNQEINKLFIVPKKETNEQMPIFYNYEEDNTHQADILFLPHDKVKGKVYAYALIVVLTLIEVVCAADIIPTHCSPSSQTPLLQQLVIGGLSFWWGEVVVGRVAVGGSREVVDGRFAVGGSREVVGGRVAGVGGGGAPVCAAFAVSAFRWDL